MQTQVKYITDLAREYKSYSEKPAELYKAVNSIPKNEAEEIFREYYAPESTFQPVQFLRAEIEKN